MNPKGLHNTLPHVHRRANVITRDLLCTDWLPPDVSCTHTIATVVQVVSNSLSTSWCIRMVVKLVDIGCTRNVILASTITLHLQWTSHRATVSSFHLRWSHHFRRWCASTSDVVRWPRNSPEEWHIVPYLCSSTSYLRGKHLIIVSENKFWLIDIRHASLTFPKIITSLGIRTWERRTATANKALSLWRSLYVGTTPVFELPSHSQALLDVLGNRLWCYNRRCDHQYLPEVEEYSGATEMYYPVSFVEEHAPGNCTSLKLLRSIGLWPKIHD